MIFSSLGYKMLLGSILCAVRCTSEHPHAPENQEGGKQNSSGNYILKMSNEDIDNFKEIGFEYFSELKATLDDGDEQDGIAIDFETQREPVIDPKFDFFATLFITSHYREYFKRPPAVWDYLNKKTNADDVPKVIIENMADTLKVLESYSVKAKALEPLLNFLVKIFKEKVKEAQRSSRSYGQSKDKETIFSTKYLLKQLSTEAEGFLVPCPIMIKFLGLYYDVPNFDGKNLDCAFDKPNPEFYEIIKLLRIESMKITKLSRNCYDSIRDTWEVITSISRDLKSLELVFEGNIHILPDTNVPEFSSLTSFKFTCLPTFDCSKLFTMAADIISKSPKISSVSLAMPSPKLGTVNNFTKHICDLDNFPNCQDVLLNRVCECRSLESLELYNVAINETNSKVVTEIIQKNSESLKTLSLGNFSVATAHESCKDLLKVEQIDTINEEDDAAVAVSDIYRAVSNLKRITSLNLHSMVGESNISAAKAIFSNASTSKLERLVISSPQMNTKSFKVFMEWLMELPNISQLEFSEFTMLNVPFEDFAKMVSKIESLSFNHNTIQYTEPEAAAESELDSASMKIRHLDLSNTRLYQFESVKPINELLMRAPGLELVNLKDVTSDSLSYIGALNSVQGSEDATANGDLSDYSGILDSILNLKVLKVLKVESYNYNITRKREYLKFFETIGTLPSLSVLYMDMVVNTIDGLFARKLKEALFKCTNLVEFKPPRIEPSPEALNDLTELLKPSFEYIEGKYYGTRSVFKKVKASN